MRPFASSALLLVFLLLACSEKAAPAPQAETPAASSAAQAAPATAPATVESAPAPKPTMVPGGTQTPAPKVAAVPAPAPKPVATSAPVLPPAPGPAPKPAAPAPTPMAATPAATTPAAPPGPMPSLANNGHAAVGADKCRMCHRVQHDSWSATAHAKKGLDCEGCHGNGADYKAMSVMKNMAAAKAAGLIMPGPDFCRKCHGAKADASLLPRAHAHKA